MAKTPGRQADRQYRMVAEWTSAVPVVTSFIRSAVTDFHAAEDILQQVAEVVVNRFDVFDMSKPFIPWAIGIARIKILEYRKNCSHDPHLFAGETLSMVATAYEKECGRFNPMRAALDSCISKLHPRGRQLLKMRYREDKKPGEIANEVGETANAIRVALHRVRLSLERCIAMTLADRSSS